jgi:hypothetical protein
MKGQSMIDKSMQSGDEGVEPAPGSAKKPYDPPVFTKLGALRDLTGTIFFSPGNRDGRKARYTGRGGVNGLSRECAS